MLVIKLLVIRTPRWQKGHFLFSKIMRFEFKHLKQQNDATVYTKLILGGSKKISGSNQINSTFYATREENKLFLTWVRCSASDVGRVMKTPHPSLKYLVYFC